MKGWWGAIGLLVVSVIGVMAANPAETRFKTESEYVNYCVAKIADAGLPEVQSRSGCQCMYREGLAALQNRGGYELSSKEADGFFDKCMGPLVAAVEAQEAWDAEGGSSDWGY